MSIANKPQPKKIVELAQQTEKPEPNNLTETNGVIQEVSEEMFALTAD